MKRILYLLGVVLLVAGLSSCCKKTTSSPLPLIGISTGVSASGTMSVGSTYLHSVENAGGLPVLLPVILDSIECENILSHLDGVILTGGEDVDPIRYGEQTLPECGRITGARDTSDLLIARCAVRNNIPLLGICRGEQVTNVALGGTLYQDLPSQVGTMVQHNQTVGRDTATHVAAILPGTHLSKVLGGIDSLGVNTFHHQAVKDLAPGMHLNAMTPDGVVEGFEGLPEVDVMAVQFHPEGFAQYGWEPYLSIFKDFISRAQKRADSR